MSTGRGAKGGPAGLSALWDPGLRAACGAGQQPDGRTRRAGGWRPPGEPHRVEAGTIRVAALGACGRELPWESLPRLPKEPFVRRLLVSPPSSGSRSGLRLRMPG